MRVFVHLLAADVRRFWQSMAAWVVVVATATVIAGIRPLLAANPRLLSVVDVAGTLLWITQLLLLFVLIALVVQTHPLVGSDAFWMTRPIPPQVLLASKLALLGLAIVAVPVVAEAVLMAAYKVPATNGALVAANTALTQTAVLVALMVAAAMTGHLPGFAVLCGSVVGGVAITLFAVATIMMSSEEFGTARLAVSYSMPLGPDEDPTGDFVGSVLVVLVGLAVLAVQYRTRSRRRAIAVTVAGVCLAAAIGHWWRWPILQARVLVPDWALAEPGLRLSADASTVDVHQELTFGRSTPWRSIRARVHLSGLAHGWFATAGLLNASIRLADGTIIRSERGGFPAAVPIEGDGRHPTRVVVGDVLGVSRVADATGPNGESPIVFVLHDRDARRPLPAIGQYLGRFQVVLARHDVEAALPLRAGATHQNGSYRIVVEDVERVPGGVSIVARESQALSPFDRAPRPMFEFYLRNRARGEAMSTHATDVQGASLSPFLPFSVSVYRSAGFIARGLMIRFPPAYIHREGFLVDDSWIAGADLVIVRTTREGSVVRDLEIQDFPLRTDP